EKKTHVVEECPEEGYSHPVEAHRGLNGMTWDLKGIFEDYFPNLHRRSALITLYSFLEHQMDELCALFIQDGSPKVALRDMRGKGIERATLFLEKVAGLRIDK